MLPSFALRATVCLVLLTFFTSEAAVATPKSSAAIQRSAAALHSRRARRRLAIFLRLKLLELRKAELDRAALVVQQRLSVDSLFLPANPLTPAKDARPASPPGK